MPSIRVRARGYESLCDASRGEASRGSQVTRHASQVGLPRGDEQWGLGDQLRRWWPWGGHQRRCSSDGVSVGSEHAIPEDALGPSRSPHAHQASRVASPSAGPALPPTEVSRAPHPPDLWSGVAHERRWMPDEKCTACFHCNAQFGAFRRRHHCRLCGQIFCYTCSRYFVEGALIGRPGEKQQRLCVSCAQYYENLTVTDHSSRRQSDTSSPSNPHVFNSGRTLGTGRNSTDFVDSSAAPQGDNASNASEPRDELVPLSISDESSDEAELNVHSMMSDQQDRMMDARSSRSGSMLSSNDDEREDWGDSNGDWKKICLSPRRRNEVGIPQDAMLQLSREEAEPSSYKDHDAKTAWRKMTEANVTHFAKQVREHCVQVGNGVEDFAHVLTICELAQKVVDHLPHSPGDQMDIMSYVKIKRIPGGSVTDSYWVDGVVFTRDLAHRKMQKTIANCNLVLLREPISFDSENRLTSLDQLIKQEATFIDLKVEKIEHDLHPRPQLLLCQGGVSQIAQEKLRLKNISLVLGVKPRILDAVARCTGASVIPSVDMITKNSKNNVGKCKNFYVRREPGEEGSKNLVVIEGSDKCSGKFSTVCLRGGGSLPTTAEAMQLLTRLKRVLQWAIRLARHLQLESELLFEMCCEPWTRRMKPALAPPSTADSGAPPSTADSGTYQAEHLDLICYTVSEKDGWSCKPPVALRMTAYEAQVPVQHSQWAQSGRGWAGGLDGEPEVIRDCTIHEWLWRCFNHDNARNKFTGVSAASVLSDEMTARLPLDAGGEPFFDPRFALDGLEGAEGLEPVGGAAGPLSRLVPRKNEILCLENKQSRVIVQIHDEAALRDERSRLRESRIRADSDWAPQQGHISQTRWAFLSPHEEDGGQDGDATAPWMSGGAPGGPGKSWRFEFWQMCRLGEGEQWRRVTPRNMLTASATWHSLAKFFDVLFNNSDSSCCHSRPVEKGCSHPAFREHILFFSCPGRRQILSLCYEPIGLWRLTPPNLPCCDSVNRCLVMGADANCQDLDRLINVLKQLVGKIRLVVDSILAALVATSASAVTSEDVGTPTPAQQGWWPIALFKENRGPCHRALKQLTGIEKMLGHRLKVAEARLDRSDPVLVASVHRDLLDMLRSDPARGGIGDATLRGAHTDLLALRPRAAPSSEATKGILPWSLAPVTKVALDALKFLRPSEVEAASTELPEIKGAMVRSVSQDPVLESTPCGCISLPRPLLVRNKSDESLSLLPACAHRGRMRRTVSVVDQPQVKTDELKTITDRMQALDDSFTKLEGEAVAEEGGSAFSMLPRGVQGLCLPVQEDDVGSVVAYALLSCQAHEQMQAQWSALTGGTPRCPLAERARRSGACGCGRGHDWSCYGSMPAAFLEGAGSATTSPWSCGPCDVPSSSQGEARQHASLERQAALERAEWKRLPGHEFRDSGGNGVWDDECKRRGARSVLTAPTLGESVKVEFGDKEGRYCVEIHHAPQYHIVRHCLCGDDLNFARSLYHCHKIKTSGGKTGSAFFMSFDRRFLLKAVNKAEFKMLEKRSDVEALFWYVDKVLFDGLPSVLVQVVGLFTVSLPRQKKGARTRHFIVQRNLRQGLESTLHVVFDLKGVGKSRRMEAGQVGDAAREEENRPPVGTGSSAATVGAESPSDPPDDSKKEESKQVLWDQNFREWTRGRPLCLVPRDLKYLEAAVWNDALLLSLQNLVDYSLLLVAAPPQSNSVGPGTLSMGIIDYLRPYTWDKQVETVVKRQWKDPTIIDPADYKARFLSAMMTFFVGEVPSST